MRCVRLDKQYDTSMVSYINSIINTSTNIDGVGCFNIFDEFDLIIFMCHYQNMVRIKL